MDDKSIQASKSPRQRSNTFKTTKIDKLLISKSKPAVFYLPQHAPTLRNQSKNQKIHKDPQNKGILSSKCISEEKKDPHIHMHRTLPYNKKSKKQKFYLWSKSPAKNQKKQLEYLLNNVTCGTEKQGKEDVKIRKIQSNLMNTCNKFNLTTLSKREEMARTMRVKELRDREKKTVEKSFLPKEVTNSPEIWSCNRSRSTFYPSKNLQFKTLNIIQQAFKASKGGVYSKYYLKRKINEPSELDITRAHFCDRKDQQKVDTFHKNNITPSLHKKPALVIHVMQKQKRSKKESKQILRGSEINGWEVDEQILT